MGVGDPGRTGQIKHDPRAARHHQAIPECLYQPAPCGADAGRKLKADLGDIDDHAIRIGKRKGTKRYRLVEVEDEAGLLAVARQADIRGDREIRRRGRFRWLAVDRATHGELGTCQCCGAQQRATQQNMMICAARQRIRASEQPSYRNRTTGLTGP